MSIILAIQEAETRFEPSPGANSSWDPNLKKPITKKGLGVEAWLKQ
jgi:hypothetical protein